MNSSSLPKDKTIFSKQQLLNHMQTLDNNSFYRKRCLIFLDTIQYIEDKSNCERIAANAERNLARWSNEVKESKQELPSSTLEVLSADWGEAALQLTKKYGLTFAVLNMANAYSPGGGIMQGHAAQEENLGRRTDFARYIDENDVKHDGFRARYSPAMTDLINGVNDEVYLDTINKRICFRGPEILTEKGLAGYQPLPDHEIFSFYELRSAAQDCRYESFNEDLARKKIRAQLNTLKKSGIRNAIFSAFGCGAFQNPPEVIARIYKEELENFRDDFDHIAFAIFYAGYGPKTNFDVFNKILLGIEPENTAQAGNNQDANTANSASTFDDAKYHQLVTEFKFFHDMLVEKRLIAETHLLKIFESPSTLAKLKSQPSLQTEAIQLMESMARFQALFQKRNQSGPLLNKVGLHKDIWEQSMGLIQEVISNCGIGGHINSPTLYRIEGLAALSKVLDKTTDLLTVEEKINSKYLLDPPEILAIQLENARLEMVAAVNAMRNTIEGPWLFRNERASRLTLGLLATLAALSSIALTLFGVLTFEITAGASAPFIYAGSCMFVPSLLLLGRSLTGGIQTKSWLQNWIGMGDCTDKTKIEAKHCHRLADTLFSFFPAPKPLVLEPDSPSGRCLPCFGSRWST